MSIAKLFQKVFGENIFEKTESEEKIYDGDVAACSVAVEELDGPKEPTVPEQMVAVKTWLNDKLADVEANCETDLRLQRQEMVHRVGPDLTIFEVDGTTTIRISSDRLAVRSQGNFNTIKANTCVFGGRWMYEIQLHTKGVMQLGWSSNKCLFNENSGVGDSQHSYGFDGSKQQSWHISTKKYGDKWQIGDIIGVTLDVERNKIEYYRNGVSMGVAFRRLEKGPGITFYPAVSLGFNQAIQANFGNFPFKYPVSGYQPIHPKPIAEVQKAELLIGYLVSLAQVVARNNSCKDKKPKDKKFSTKKTVYVVFCTLIVEKLSPVLFDAYVIESKLLPAIMQLCYSRTDAEKEGLIHPGAPESVLGTLLSLMWNYLEHEEIRYTLRKLVNGLLSLYTRTYKALDLENQKKAIFLMICLCNHQRTRRHFIEYKMLKKHCLPLFMAMRGPDYAFLQELMPDENAWTEGIDGPKIKYLATAERISKTFEPLYNLQKNFLFALLNNTDGTEALPSSRKLFLLKLRRYVIDTSLEQKPFHSLFMMQSSLQYPIESPVALSFLCILVDVSKTLFEKELPGVPAEVHPQCFLDGSFEYYHFDRLGGVLSHLRKIHRNEVIIYLGPERGAAALEEPRVVIQGDIDPTMLFGPFNMNNLTVVGTNQDGPASTFTHFFNPRLTVSSEVRPGNVAVNKSLYELIDLCILYYYSVGHKYIVKIAGVRDEIAALNEILKETKFYREDVERKLKALEDHASVCMNESHCNTVSELKAKFGQRENVFAKRSIELARKQIWYRSVALGKQRHLLLIWLLERDLNTLHTASNLGPLFSFLPEVYVNILPILLDAVVDFAYHDLYVQFELTDAECVINKTAEFLGLHSADPLIVLASCKDSLLQALGTMTCHKMGIKALEKSSKKCQASLVRSLLRPYENRAWGQSNWLLLRFWLGDGFCYRDSRQPSVWQGGNIPIQLGLCRSRAKNEQHTGLLHNVAPANPSKHFQKIIGNKLKEDEPFATAFMNSVLSQLNWAFSEFILLLQEIQNSSHRQESVIFEPKQLKICAMCFELTVSLMRCLEMVLSMAPMIVQDTQRANSDLILNRICQLISQVLSRITVPPGCFQFVVDMCSVDLGAVTHFPIITAALGIILVLMKPEMDTEQNPAKVTRVARALLTDPSFQFASLEFALGEIKTPILQQADIPRGNFDPSTRGHIDPLTNDVRVPMPTTSKRIRADPPIIKFSLTDFPTHVKATEIEQVRRLIDVLRTKQNLLSDITLPSEDSLCPICCAKAIAVTFMPCKHQSCSNCILQHMMSSKACFYCKTPIKSIEAPDGSTIYENLEYVATPEDTTNYDASF